MNKLHWHSGHNMPGYLPDGDIGTHETFENAQDSLAEDLADTASSLATWVDPHDCDDIPCPTYGDNCSAGKVEECNNAIPMVYTFDEYGGHVWAADYEWWLEPCTVEGCLDDEEEWS